MRNTHVRHTVKPPPQRRPRSQNTPQSTSHPPLTGSALRTAPSGPSGHVIRGSVVEYDLEGVSGWHTWCVSPRPDKTPLPSRSNVESVIAAAMEPERRLALWRERGIPLPPDVGWDEERRAWVFLIRDADGFVVNVEWRPERGKSMRWRGHDEDRPMRLGGRRIDNGCLPLFPRIPRSDTWLLVAGTWDVLAALRAGLPAVTGLTGCRWDDAWNEQVVGKRVAVCYDMNERAAARRTATYLRTKAGAADAWAIDLGLPGEKDDIEDALRPKKYGGYGWTSARLREICNLEQED
jgi:hypothetical protein